MYIEFFFHLINVSDIGIHLFIKIERKKRREERGRERRRKRKKMTPIIKIYIIRQRFNKPNLKNL